MTCVHTPWGILTLSDESEPFFYRGQRYVVSKQWGPFGAKANGDPLKHQSSGRKLQAAYEHWRKIKP